MFVTLFTHCQQQSVVPVLEELTRTLREQEVSLDGDDSRSVGDYARLSCSTSRTRDDLEKGHTCTKKTPGKRIKQSLYSRPWEVTDGNSLNPMSGGSRVYTVNDFHTSKGQIESISPPLLTGVSTRGPPLPLPPGPDGGAWQVVVLRKNYLPPPRCPLRFLDTRYCCEWCLRCEYTQIGRPR